MRIKALARVLAPLLMLVAGSAYCSHPLMVHFGDPRGDSGGRVDVADMVMKYDNATGAYEISLISTADSPFVGQFRIDVNLFNPDTGTRSCTPSWFADMGNDYDLANPVREITLVGTSQNLLGWTLSDRVGTSGAPFGSPDCLGGFVSTVSDLPLISGDSDSIAGGDVHELVDPSGSILRDRFEPVSIEPNQLPVAGPNRTVAALEDETVAVVLTGSDADGDDLAFDIAVAPEHGQLGPVTATGETSATATYTPNDDFSGEDTFSFVAGDGDGDSQLATMLLSVFPVPDAPVAEDSAATTDEDIDVTIELTGVDVDGDVLDFAVNDGPTNGTLMELMSTGDQTAEVTYVPDSDFNGSDGFTYTVDDGIETSAPASVSLSINPVNDAPVADDRSATTQEGFAVEVELTGSDVEGDALGFAVSEAPDHGVLSSPVSAGSASAQVTYTPDDGYSGQDSFKYIANDGDLDSVSANVSITIEDSSASITASRDNSIFSESGTISNGAGKLYSGRTNSGNLRRALLYFDIAGNVPASATIVSATLELQVDNSGPSASNDAYDLHPLTTDWGEGDSYGTGSGAPAISPDATWDDAKFGLSVWISPGGDFLSPVATTTIEATNGTYAWSSAGMASNVQNWLDDPGNNFGWILIGNESTDGTARRFGSRELGIAPVLVVDYE